MLKANHDYIKNLINLLLLFNKVSGMDINRSKNITYGILDGEKLEWLDSLGLRWTRGRKLSKLLGTTFGLNLNYQDVNDFLFQKVRPKLI